MTPSEHVEKIRAQWRAVGDGFRDGKEINLPGLLLTYAGDVGDLLTYLAASESARAAAEEQLASSAERERALRAYAMALRGDLVAVIEMEDYTYGDKHMQGTLDEDVAALAAAVAEEAAPRE